MILAARKEVTQRKLGLLRSLRQATQDGTWKAGEMLPTIRDLAQQYGVSPWVVTQEIQKLADEGVLHTIPRVGTFVGRQTAAATDYYLMLHQRKTHVDENLRQTQIGFEARVAALGGASLVMPLDAALEHRRRGELPTLSGVFDFAYAPGDEIYWEEMHGVPTVCFSPAGVEALNANALHDRLIHDEVSFDEIDGGRQATRHLLQLGNYRIAFLGLHRGSETPSRYFWSAQREAGWLAEMEKAGHTTEGMSFHPPLEPVGRPHSADRDGEIRVATEAAHALVRQRDISAVVAANDYAALGLFEALRAANIPGELWPSVIGFDDLPQTQSYVLTSLRLPWEEVGKAAIDLLWERRQGQLAGPAQERRIKMRLISRLTSRHKHSQSANLAALAPALL